MYSETVTDNGKWTVFISHIYTFHQANLGSYPGTLQYEEPKYNMSERRLVLVKEMNFLIAEHCFIIHSKSFWKLISNGSWGLQKHSKWLNWAKAGVTELRIEAFKHVAGILFVILPENIYQQIHPHQVVPSGKLL